MISYFTACIPNRSREAIILHPESYLSWSTVNQSMDCRGSPYFKAAITKADITGNLHRGSSSVRRLKNMGLGDLKRGNQRSVARYAMKTSQWSQFPVHHGDGFTALSSTQSKGRCILSSLYCHRRGRCSCPSGLATASPRSQVQPVR